MAATEVCFVVEALYAQRAAELRVPHREAHLGRLAMLSDEGALVLGGAFDDLSASLLVFAVATEEAVAAIIESDVYWRNKVWTSYRIRKLNRVLFMDA